MTKPGINKLAGIEDEIKIAQCYRCRHFEGGTRCAAFLHIPDVILNNFHDHRQPYPGDNGIRFEPLEIDE